MEKHEKKIPHPNYTRSPTTTQQPKQFAHNLIVKIFKFKKTAHTQHIIDIFVVVMRFYGNCGGEGSRALIQNIMRFLYIESGNKYTHKKSKSPLTHGVLKSIQKPYNEIRSASARDFLTRLFDGRFKNFAANRLAFFCGYI